MKIGRVSYQGRVRMVLVDEASSKVSFVGGSFAQHLNPVQAVIERRMTAAELKPLIEGEAGFADVSFLAPVSVPVRNIFAVGKNYTEHASEFDKSGFNATSGAAAIPAFPQIFTKATTSLAGPRDDIRFDPAHTSSVDYEGEIGVVIGAECRNVSKADALGKVFGFVALNDVTARDLQKNHAQWFLGKSLDTFCPLGPWISTADESPIASLKVQTWVNGELRQTGVLADLIFDVPTLIATLSKAMTLLPGDIIATGTPVGVGIGFTPPKFLHDGDLVRVAVTGLGELNNRVRTL
ncbi:fumarylacetoacetate hydrolase family protein [Polaromonas sp. CT11-55]|uniref:fumarylacetoacetate hydrolase family protein n=1 Tax=Polaromonas sp. CT11-55 TaxID=3243045 RepID=UPI0039A5B150